MRGLARSAPAGWAAFPRFRTPGAAEMEQFHAEFAARGWPAAEVALIPTHYREEESGLEPAGFRPAALYGDLDSDRRPEWLVGFYTVSRLSVGRAPAVPPRGAPAAAALPGTESEHRARVALFRPADDGSWILSWCSPGLGFEFRAPQFNLREVQAGLDERSSLRPPLSPVDIDGDGQPEIVYHCWGHSASIGALSGVLRREGSRWLSIAPQADRFSLRDMDADGRLEVVTGSPYVGYGMGDDDVPLVWRWRSGQYVEASREFPGFYANLVARYEAHVGRLEARGERFDREAWSRAIRKAASLAG